MDRSFQYRSDIQEIPTIRKDLEFLNTEWSIPKSETRQILLIIEEIFSNIVRYGFIEDKHEHHVDIRLGLQDGQIEIEIIDGGIAFNPLEYQIARMSDPTTSDAGGMGLSLIRTFSKQIEYQRISGKNYLKITKKVKNK
jgi:anti-sigma regulatory factor (Ser/Thr protein kinase)